MPLEASMRERGESKGNLSQNSYKPSLDLTKKREHIESAVSEILLYKQTNGYPVTLLGLMKKV